LYYVSPLGKARAVRVAEGYLMKKYGKEFEYLRVCVGIIDPAYYHVIFKTETDIIFEVYVGTNHSLRADNNGQPSSDNLITNFFVQEAVELYTAQISSIIGSDAHFSIPITQRKYDYNKEVQLASELDFDAVKNELAYSCYISIAQADETDHATAYTKKIAKLFNWFKSVDFLPTEIVIVFKNDVNVFVDFKEWQNLDVASIAATIQKELNENNQ
jgi:hypothetical protein